MIRSSTLAAGIGIREQAEVEILVSHLTHSGYVPALRSMFRSVFASGKLPEPDEQVVEALLRPTYPAYVLAEAGRVLGELFLTDEFAYLLVPGAEDTLEASVVGCTSPETALSGFCTEIEEGVKSRFDGRRVRGMKFEWSRPATRSSRYARRMYTRFGEFLDRGPQRGAAELESTEPSYRAEDAEAANFMAEGGVREFVSKLARVGKMLKKDAEDAIGEPATVDNLLALGLLAEEYLLTCKQDQHTICVVPDKDHLTSESMASLQCSVCNRSFPDENLQVIYTLTSRGKKLVDSSSWMSVWITDLLENNGVTKEAVRWGLEAGGEELDIMIEEFDSRIFFELKDREFGLGDAYPFIYRITRYAGDVGVVATMDKVSTDAKSFFKEETEGRRGYPVQIRYFEGAKGIRRGIAELVHDMSLLQVQRLLLPLNLRLGFDLWPLLESWIDRASTRSEKNALPSNTDHGAKSE